MLIGGLTSLIAFVGSLTFAASGSHHQPALLSPSEMFLKRQQQAHFNIFDPSKYDSSDLLKKGRDERSFQQQQQRNYYQHEDDRTDIKFAQLHKREATTTLAQSSAASISSDEESKSIQNHNNSHNYNNNNDTSNGTADQMNLSTKATTIASIPTSTSTTPTEYATVNYDGVIGINATDKLSLTTESRSFGVPIISQILMCLLYGTLAFTAIASNMIVCYIVLSDQRMRTATNYFIVNLAVGDILMALLCIPFTFIANLIYQYWPFGLSLCVIVSYAQANTVFISAYTMVAISIDKYLAIMYPMRLRMPKRQAKILILVIWSAALLTSLPTALLSGLAPASLDSFSTTNMTESSTTPKPIPSPSPSTLELKQRQQLESSSPSPDNHDDWHQPTSSMPPISEPILNMDELRQIDSKQKAQATKDQNTQHQHQHQHQHQQQEQQRKYFCQESWTFWPGGRYYYSTALMILQYVLPLFVLVITYSRIVIVVWGKRIPGEEDNARDARMVRSKRKMIKMVIFCVIAFALTWLPFNALIVIGDMNPDIWENQNIIFRAGFKQVIWDLYVPIKRLLAYLWYWGCCLGCLLACSRRKYSRVSSSLRGKQVLKPTGSGLNSGNHNTTTYNIAGTTQAAHNQASSLGAAYAKHPQSQSLLAPATSQSGDSPTPLSSKRPANGDDGDERSDEPPRHFKAPATLGAATSGGPPVMKSDRRGSHGTGNGAQQASNTSRAPRISETPSRPPGKHDNDQHHGQPRRKELLQADPDDNGCKLARASSWTGGSAGRQLGADCSGIPSEHPVGVFEPQERGAADTNTPTTNAKPKWLDGAGVEDPSQAQSELQSKSSYGHHQGSIMGSACSAKLAATATAAAPSDRKRTRKKPSHGINIQMTTREYRKPPPHSTHLVTDPPSTNNKNLVRDLQAAIDNASLTNNKVAPTTRAQLKPHHKSWWRKSKSSAMRDRGCPACSRKALATGNNSNPGLHSHHQPGDEIISGCNKSSLASSSVSFRQPLGASRGGLGKRDEFIVDMRKSSQSTATVSLLTNTTSLTMSPLDSMRNLDNINNNINSTPTSYSSPLATRHNDDDRPHNSQSSDREQMAAAAAEPLEQQEVAEPQAEQRRHYDDILQQTSTKGQAQPARLAAGVIYCGESIRYVDETDSSDKSRNEHPAVAREPKPSPKLAISFFAGQQAANTRPPMFKGEDASSPPSSAPSPAGSTSLSDPPGGLRAKTGSNTSADGESITGQYCCEHRRAEGLRHHLSLDGRRGAGEENGGNSGTDNDVCDIVFHDNRSRSRPLRAQESATIHRCNGSLELLSDEFDDDDDDDEEIERLEAEYGDERQSSVGFSYAMVPLNSFRPDDGDCDSLDVGSSRRQTQLLNGAFQSTGDNLYVFMGGGLSPQEAEVPEIPRQHHSLGASTTNGFCGGHRITNGSRSDSDSNSNSSTNSTDETTNTNDDHDGHQAKRMNGPANNIISDEQPQYRASSEWRFLEAKDRSLRRAMLLNNHLLSSLGNQRGRMSKVSLSGPPSANHLVIASKSMNYGPTPRNGDGRWTSGQKAASVSNADTGSARNNGQPTIERFTCQREQQSSRPATTEAARKTSGDRQSSNGLPARSPVDNSNGCDNGEEVAAAIKNGFGDNQSSSSSSAPASIMKNTTTTSELSQAAASGSLYVPINGRQQRHPAQMLLAWGRGLNRRGPPNQQRQHHSLTSLNFGHQTRAEQATNPSAPDGFKSLDEALALVRSHDGVDEMPWEGLMGTPKGRRHELGAEPKEQPIDLEGSRLFHGPDVAAHRARGGDLIDRLGGVGGQKKLSPSSGDQQPLVSPGGRCGGCGDGDNGADGHHKRPQQRDQLQLSWTKSASTMVVRKSPTVYLISKPSAAMDHADYKFRAQNEPP